MNEGVLLVILFGFLIVVLGLVNPYVPIQEVPNNELRVVAGTQAAPATFHQGLKAQSDFNNAHVVKQQYDYSCGSAALATLLNYYLGEQLTEKQIIQALIEYGDKQQIEKLRAFSLLDMKRFVEKLGYKGVGYKAEIEDLKKLGKPCIVPVEIFGYSHFCVFRGIVQDHVFLADPYLGNVSYTVEEFRKMWQRNVAFVVTDGEIVHSALMLKEEDLRFVDLDATRQALNNFHPPTTSVLMENLRIDNAMGVRPTAR
ncbi:MAG: peptidase C39 [Deltaproteobacteria bacterium HGW-Deltaproteobacteria-1]|nr:MAG: peptidase C39 [Deltaproteobacteria bacterium HGW-Deltaproteobacteria-1]